MLNSVLVFLLIFACFLVVLLWVYRKLQRRARDAARKEAIDIQLLRAELALNCCAQRINIIRLRCKIVPEYDEFLQKVFPQECLIIKQRFILEQYRGCPGKLSSLLDTIKEIETALDELEPQLTN